MAATPSINVDRMGVATFEVTGGLWKLILDDTAPPGIPEPGLSPKLRPRLKYGRGIPLELL